MRCEYDLLIKVVKNRNESPLKVGVKEYVGLIENKSLNIFVKPYVQEHL